MLLLFSSPSFDAWLTIFFSWKLSWKMLFLWHNGNKKKKTFFKCFKFEGKEEGNSVIWRRYTRNWSRVCIYWGESINRFKQLSTGLIKRIKDSRTSSRIFIKWSCNGYTREGFFGNWHPEDEEKIMLFFILGASDNTSPW